MIWGYVMLKAQSCLDDFRRDAYMAGSGYVAYPGPERALTPAPKGYEAVYLSHYGRHGSRYHIGSTYGDTYGVLAKADSLGVLTEKGREVFLQVAMLREEARGRDGELTELGALQHRQIAERMYRNFPGVFRGRAHIDAKSTVVIRCILSMENALQTLKALNPKLDIRHDASEHDMWYMNRRDPAAMAARDRNRQRMNEYWDEHTHPERLMSVLFGSEAFWQDSIDARRLMRNLYELAVNVQSSEMRHRMNMMPLFTLDELYDLWQNRNAYFYVMYGPSRYSEGLPMLSQRCLLGRMVSEADSCLRLDHCGAHLRYGHDTMVMPLTCLMGLDGTNRSDITDLDRLPMEEWCDYRIFPMACNIQLVFYRSKGAKGGTATKDSRGNDILVKILRNENEAHLPIPTDRWPYYRWQDVREYWLSQ